MAEAEGPLRGGKGSRAAQAPRGGQGGSEVRRVPPGPRRTVPAHVATQILVVE